MKEIFSKLKLPIIVMAVLFGGLIVYKGFIQKPAPSGALTSTQTTAPGPEVNFLPLLIRVQAVTLDEKIFDDPVFKALDNNSLEIYPEPKGRENPFSTILGPSSSSSVESLGFTDTTATTTVKKK